MHCTRKITQDITWIGSQDRRLALFESAYAVPRGVTYNSYLISDLKTCVVDTVDASQQKQFLENLEYALDGRGLDFLLVQHMEPDHSASIEAVLAKYPAARLVCTQKTLDLITQFFGYAPGGNIKLIAEGAVLELGAHKLTFVAAPMVHWPEVIVSYDLNFNLLFSADAFGTFGAGDGAVFADEVRFMETHLAEARRYYTNIVGKYGAPVTALLEKAARLPISMILPLHGFVWRQDIGEIFEKYQKWASYTPEDDGVVIAYASVYGGTENACNILAARLREKGTDVRVYDVAVTPAPEILAEGFRAKKLVFAAPTIDGGLFPQMEALLRKLAEHGLKNRVAAFIENGTWGPVAVKKMREITEKLGWEEVGAITLKSSVTEENLGGLTELAEKLA
ncbi:MAG: FprA family A-type flavoprotein [Oscillospiraceae bacterium]|jgi:flavorubredoxin|nr:FprA family A-type flavoprotein [Oscillospiraceae bacterium]